MCRLRYHLVGLMLWHPECQIETNIIASIRNGQDCHKDDHDGCKDGHHEFKDCHKGFMNSQH